MKSVRPNSKSEDDLKLEKERLQAILDRPKGESIAKVREDMAVGMTKGIGVWRDQKSMDGALENLKTIKNRLLNVSVEDKGKFFNNDMFFESVFNLCCKNLSLLKLKLIISTGVKNQKQHFHKILQYF